MNAAVVSIRPPVRHPVTRAELESVTEILMILSETRRELELNSHRLIEAWQKLLELENHVCRDNNEILYQLANGAELI